MTKKYAVLALLLILLISGILWAKETFSGKVVAVKDGDTIEVLRDGKAVRIRLQGIDCPESKQAFGSKARAFTSDLVFGREVTVIASTTDRYGRLVANVIFDRDRNLNQELVKAGYAWWYKRYAKKDKALKALEKQARDSHVGLWSDPRPIPPWEFRKMKRESSQKEKETVDEKAR